MGGKAASDYAEVFDGFLRQHDGEDAAVLAELSAFGKSQPYRELASSNDILLLLLSQQQFPVLPSQS